MKTAIFFDKDTGGKIADWLIDNYPKDLILLVSKSPNPVLDKAENKSIKTLIYESEKQIFSFLNNLPFLDLGILAWWPHIVSERNLKIPKYGFINTHPSYLPHGRGKNYNFWAIIDESPFGVSLHFVEKEIDAGKIIAQKKIDFGWEDTGETLYNLAANEILDLFISNYPKMRIYDFKPKVQNLNLGSFHLAKEMSALIKIDLDKQYTARYLLNLIRAKQFKDFSSCYFEENGEKFSVRVQIEKERE